jgi:hypothetical protein
MFDDPIFPFRQMPKMKKPSVQPPAKRIAGWAIGGLGLEIKHKRPVSGCLA